MDLSDAYENGAYIPQSHTYADMWAGRAADLRASLGARAECGLAYGDADRERFDLFHPEGAAKGLVVFIHGGYWKAFDRSGWSHLAAGPLASGWAVAMPSYTLAPEARIAGITRQIATAVAAAADRVAGPLVITGHSAGGHLSARMRCADVALPDAVAGRIARILPISPLSDLRPLMQTAMNDILHLDEDEARAESPILCDGLRDIETLVWVGGAERPAFLEQARWLAEAWPDTSLRIVPERHHFDVIEDLEREDSPMTQALLSGL